MLGPLAFGKAASIILSCFGVQQNNLSYAHTVKATMPIFTAVLGWIFFRQRQPLKVCLSFLPILLGVGLCTITELEFNLWGLLSSLGAIAAYAGMQLFSKRVMEEMNPKRLLFLLTLMALLQILPLWLFSDLPKLAAAQPVEAVEILEHPKSSLPLLLPFPTLALLLLDGTLHLLQSVMAFSILGGVSALTYSVCNATKRVFVIGTSLVLMKNPVTRLNILGMAVAVSGVFMYNKASSKRKPLLPLVRDRENPLLRTGGIDWSDKLSSVYQPPVESANPAAYSTANGYSKAYTAAGDTHSNGLIRTVMAA